MNNQLTRNQTNLTNTNMSPTSQENRLDQERQTINTILNNNAATTTTLQLQNNDERNDLHWGDKISNKLDHHLRIGCRNINGMPLSSIHSKNDEIVRDINATQFDIFGMTETNINWRKLEDKDRLHGRMRGRFEFSNKSFSYNTNESFNENFNIEEH